MISKMKPDRSIVNRKTVLTAAAITALALSLYLHRKQVETEREKVTALTRIDTSLTNIETALTGERERTYDHPEVEFVFEDGMVRAVHTPSGIAADGESKREAMMNLDQAVYEAKEAGKIEDVAEDDVDIESDGEDDSEGDVADESDDEDEEEIIVD